MKFLADAHISVEMIRELGHECADASAIPPRMPDADVLRSAANHGSIIVTSDKDLGELVFVHKIVCLGVILIRVALPNEKDRVNFVRSVWSPMLSRLPGSFITITLAGVCVRPLL